MSKKIFRSVVTVAVTVLLVSLAFTVGFLYDYFNKSQAYRLKEELLLASEGVEHSGTAYFENYSSDLFRFTVVYPDGSVLYDSQIKDSGLENHINRKEIKEALLNGSGSSARYSETLTERTLYEAVRLSDGNVLRISVTQITVAALIIGMSPVICAVILISVLIAVILSVKTAKSIVKPLEELDFENPESNSTYEELTPILSRLSRQHRQIKSQLERLKRKSDEFKQITDSLSEGIALLDKNGNTLVINSSAEKNFGTNAKVQDNSLLSVGGEALKEAVKQALSGKHNEFGESLNGREYRFKVSPNISDGKLLGAVILCIDISEATLAERSRREFTANVSHELKTPLQSIIGSAELLENGLVKPGDTEKFVGNIKNEAVRLVALINDIIRLSQLDEQTELPLETVDLLTQAVEVAEALSEAAAKKRVGLSVTGEHCTVNGVKRYIYEIIYNLCDNAVRYNKIGGTVEISVKHKNGKTVLSVSDTGVGIPKEHTERIFERFYRVDKSHSRETGGTGLGLSIVKHAAACLGATVRLESTENVGTTVAVTF